MINPIQPQVHGLCAQLCNLYSQLIFILALTNALSNANKVWTHVAIQTLNEVKIHKMANNDCCEFLCLHLFLAQQSLMPTTIWICMWCLDPLFYIIITYKPHICTIHTLCTYALKIFLSSSGMS